VKKWNIEEWKAETHGTSAEIAVNGLHQIMTLGILNRLPENSAMSAGAKRMMTIVTNINKTARLELITPCCFNIFLLCNIEVAFLNMQRFLVKK